MASPQLSIICSYAYAPGQPLATPHHAMAVVHRQDQLLEEPACLVFVQPPARRCIPEQVAAGGILHGCTEQEGGRRNKRLGSGCRGGIEEAGSVPTQSVVMAESMHGSSAAAPCPLQLCPPQPLRPRMPQQSPRTCGQSGRGSSAGGRCRACLPVQGQSSRRSAQRAARCPPAGSPLLSLPGASW